MKSHVHCVLGIYTVFSVSVTDAVAVIMSMAVRGDGRHHACHAHLPAAPMQARRKWRIAHLERAAEA
jgi:hypothetical protein